MDLDRAPGVEGGSQFEAGLLFGLLVGEGHFGGDGRQAQITLRMHVRHEKLFRWLESSFPEGRLYGPYRHGGREYFQWMARGSFLREVLVPFLSGRRAFMDDYVAARFEAMCERYALRPEIGGPDEPPVLSSRSSIERVSLDPMTVRTSRAAEQTPALEQQVKPSHGLSSRSFPQRGGPRLVRRRGR